MKRALLAVCGVVLSMPAFAGGHFAPHSFSSGLSVAGVTRPHDVSIPPDAHGVLSLFRPHDVSIPPDAFRVGRPASDVSIPPDAFRVGHPASDVSIPPDAFRVGRPAGDVSIPPESHMVGVDRSYGPLVKPAWAE
jgi:hypothetical protein